MIEFKLVSVISFLFHHFPHIYKSKGEIRNLIQQQAITFYFSFGEIKPTIKTGFIYDIDHNFVGVINDKDEILLRYTKIDRNKFG
jgi:hypothetical protein